MTKFFALGVFACLLVILASISLRREPEHAGRPVRAWFQDMCLAGFLPDCPKGKPGRVFQVTCVEFSKMDSSAVPYLVRELRYDRRGVLERLMLSLNHCRLTFPITEGFVYPSQRRMYAAGALGLMGSRAESAVPDLMEAWSARERPEVKREAVKAINSILRSQGSSNPSSADSDESRVIAEAARRFPQAAARLGILHAE